MTPRWWMVLAVAALWALVVFGSSRCTPAASRATLIPLDAAEIAQLDAQATALCSRVRGQQASYVQLADGVLVCADKPARRPRSEITTAWKVER